MDSKQSDACWIPGHTDITGNDSADSVAKLEIRYRPYGNQTEKVRND